MKQFKHATLLDIQNVISHFVGVVMPQKLYLLICKRLFCYINFREKVFMGPMASRDGHGSCNYTVWPSKPSTVSGVLATTCKIISTKYLKFKYYSTRCGQEPRNRLKVYNGSFDCSHVEKSYSRTNHNFRHTRSSPECLTARSSTASAVHTAL